MKLGRKRVFVLVYDMYFLNRVCRLQVLSFLDIGIVSIGDVRVLDVEFGLDMKIGMIYRGDDELDLFYKILI